MPTIHCVSGVLNLPRIADFRTHAFNLTLESAAALAKLDPNGTRAKTAPAKSTTFYQQVVIVAVYFIQKKAAPY
jgi:hypothetical protein